MLKNQYALSGMFSIVMGLLLMTMKGQVVSIVLTILGLALLLSAFKVLRRCVTKTALLKAAAGVFLIVFGWTFINLSLYVLALALSALGIAQTVNLTRAIRRRGLQVRSLRLAAIYFLKPVLTLVAGLCLLFNPSGSVDTLFVVTGLLLIISGFFDAFNAFSL